MRVKTKLSAQFSLRDAADEFLSYKQAQKVRERTLKEYKTYINGFIQESSNSLEMDLLTADVISYFSDIPNTSPARFNHPYQYLHALFSWCAKQDYIPYNPFDKLELKKRRDDGHVLPATISDIPNFSQCQPIPPRHIFRNENISKIFDRDFKERSTVVQIMSAKNHLLAILQKDYPTTINYFLAVRA